MAEVALVGAPGTSSSLYKFNLIQPKPNGPAWPRPRSGHRTFVDNDFFYVIGGYTDNPEDSIFRELWKFNLVSQTWTACNIPENFPRTLASFACQSSGNGSFIVYGGTGIPFGQELDETVYMGRVIGDDIRIEQVNPISQKRGCYGHVLVYDSKRNKTFSIGGTDGTQFKLDVHALQRNDATGQWEWEEYASYADDIGLYRMEAILENDSIYIFGGGTTQRIASFRTISVFNLERRVYEIIDTEPDPVHGHPPGRRCHSLVQWGRQVIIAGGCYDDSRVSNPPINVVLSCVWSFNLDTHVWRKMDDLPNPVYFHDASITAEGQMIIFGGVSNTNNPRGRVADLQTLWLGPPTLFSTALAKMKKIANVTLNGNEFLLSDRLNLTRQIYSHSIQPA